VARELEALGEQPRIEAGGVSWDGDARSMMRANLWLRTASRVIVRVASFRATAFFELEKRAKTIPWKDFLGEAIPEFRVTARKSKLYHSDAIAERLAKAASGEGEAAKSVSTQLFVVRVERDQFTISADTSGELLHMRGYRQAVGKAPLRETLAAALLMAAGWKGDVPLVDPMCGSGTISIEGALMARRIAPGLNREFQFRHWPSFDAAGWKALLADARSKQLASGAVEIAAYDRDAGAISNAKANAARAGVERDITFEQQPISAFHASTASGLVATNPPYGVRVGDSKALRNLYAQLGNILREKAAGWTLAMLASDQQLVKQTQLKLASRFKSTNGGIRVGAYVGEVI
jgi:putative N6-adenine-specific DNA methylase